MNEPAVPLTIPAPPSPRSEPVGWAVVFGVVASLALAVLAGGLLVMDAIAYGIAAVFAPDALAAPDDGRYLLALVFGVVVCMAGAPAMAWVGFGKSSRTWPALVQGLAAAVVAAVASVCTLLLMLGINPIDFVAAL